MSLLTCEALTKRFGGLLAVGEVSFSVDKDQILALIGPNGAGKSTILNLISGFMRPESGSVHLDGRRVDGLAPHVIAAHGVRRTFQLESLFPSLSVMDNLRLGALHATGPPADLPELCELIGLSAHESKLAKVLPYGLRRRLAVGIALAGNPTLLLLDEPAAGLNFTESMELVELIRTVRDAGVTIVLIEHDMAVVSQAADEVVVVDHGRVIATGNPAEVLSDKTVVEVYLGQWFQADAQ
jgi:ABC-type branched-subunit amino acid transport system ATPase component